MNNTDHWRECSICKTKDLAVHTPGAEATETSAQICTVCGYEIAPALGETNEEISDMSKETAPAGSTEPTEPAEQDLPPQEKFSWWIILVAVVVVGGGAVAFIILKKKK
jgi:hypothetical protein